MALFFNKFNVKSIRALEKLIKSKKLDKLKGWGDKSQADILHKITVYKRFKNRFLLGKIYPLANNIINQLTKEKLIDKAAICGSVRRGKETVGDLDILVTSKKPLQAIDFFCSMNFVKKILLKGNTKARVLIKSGPETDLRVVKPASFGSAMHYFTGSRSHNIKLRKLGISKGLKINEYGVFKNNRKIAGRTETSVFEAVKIPFIPPEIREGMNEIKIAQENKLPKLINFNDIKGDLHLHTKWSDGTRTIIEMAKHCQAIGYKYIAITDHASPLKIVNGLDKHRILKYIKAIKLADKKVKGIKILAGAEVDIKKDGSLFLPDKILKKLDLVIASVHSGFKMNEIEMTRRIKIAIRNPCVHIIGHPTGRLINRREPYKVDMEEILKTAKDAQKIIEINAFYTRLDLNAIHVKMAKDIGVKMVISTDSHSTSHLNTMFYGILTARRGWLEVKDVVNAKSFKQFARQLKIQD